jgi:hypothetical protein
MIVSINQPAYLPWLGCFHRIAISDLHIVLDHVQFEKNSFANRNKVRAGQGWCWLTVPLKTKGQFGALELNRVEIDRSRNWAAKHWATLSQSYARAPYFEEHREVLESVYGSTWHRLSDLTRALTHYQLRALNIATPLRYSSEMNIEGAKDELVLELCRAVGATVYISGPLGRNYLRPHLFERAGISVVYHDYLHPRYHQIHPGFEPQMAALDLLFNEGPRSLETLTSGNTGLEPIRMSGSTT